ncbi:unnamed protein product [Owenia fusiformis]|uniref:Uncharacterized protein n=1 Tax=Owenia fusiformis TaxID=6347 RepID=A0A8J1UX59_OWEFU|nr:unnamed protein product [Owenia fusiformis]
MSKSHFTTKEVPSNEATSSKSYSVVDSSGPQSTSCFTVGNVIEAAKTMSDCSTLCDDSSNQIFAHFSLKIKQEFLRQSQLKKLQSSHCKRNISNEKNRKMDKLRKRRWRESEVLKKHENRAQKMFKREKRKDEEYRTSECQTEKTFKKKKRENEKYRIKEQQNEKTFRKRKRENEEYRTSERETQKREVGDLHTSSKMSQKV